MTSKEKIILYLDNQMTSEEKQKFEIELKDSNQLRDELARYKQFNIELGSLQYPEATEDYYNTLIPRFRENQSIWKKKKYIPILGYGVSTIAAAVIIFLLFFNKTEEKNFLIFDNYLTDKEASEIITDYSNPAEQLEEIPGTELEAASQMFDSLIVAELDLGEREQDNILISDHKDLTDIIETIDDNEAEYVYAQIINKQFFGNKQ